MQFEVEYGFMQYDNKIETTKRNPLAESSKWKQSWKCSKTILEGSFANKCNMSCKTSLKESEESSKS
jgi:hypothetical protein